MATPKPVFDTSRDTNGRESRTGRSFLGKIGGVLLWTVLITLGALLGLAAVSAIVSRDAVPVDSPTSGDFSNEIQSSTPRAVQPPDDVLLAELMPLPMAGGENALQANGLTIVPLSTECGIERVLEWSKPGGVYCAITLSVYGQGLGVAQMRADQQAIYPIDPEGGGYQGSFFIAADNIPRRMIETSTSEESRVVLIVDTPRGFLPAQAYFRSNLSAT